jgi:hypothetical protein
MYIFSNNKKAGGKMKVDMRLFCLIFDGCRAFCPISIDWPNNIITIAASLYNAE